MSFALSMALFLTLFSNIVIFFYNNEKVWTMVKSVIGHKNTSQKDKKFCFSGFRFEL